MNFTQARGNILIFICLFGGVVLHSIKNAVYLTGVLITKSSIDVLCYVNAEVLFYRCDICLYMI